MGSKSLRYFRYMLKSQQSNLCAGFSLPTIILKTTAIQPFNQSAQSKYFLKYFTLPVNFLSACAAGAKHIIIRCIAVCNSSLAQAAMPMEVNWRSYFRALSPEMLGTLKMPGLLGSVQYSNFAVA